MAMFLVSIIIIIIIILLYTIYNMTKIMFVRLIVLY